MALSLAARALAPISLPAQPTQPAQPETPWSYSASATVKEAFDSNVFLQDHGDQAGRESFVTTFLPSLGLSYQAGDAFHAALAYSPEVGFYHSESSEDFVAHLASLNFNGAVNNTAWELLNSVVWIDGNELGPRFTGGGDIPAIGGIPLRDRRAAIVYRNSFKLQQTWGKFFLRPIINSYVHDFRTELHQTTEPGFTGYENYIDRFDVRGGVDLGYEVAARTWVVAAYRYGHQEQGKNQFGAESPLSNHYQRFAVGGEGSPTDWLKLSVLGGPDIRDFGDRVPPGFDKNETLFAFDASATLFLTKRDTVVLGARRFEQPAFSSHSMYEDIVYEGTWRHKFNDHLKAGAGLKVYGGDWQAPVNREDWIFTPSASLSYKFNKHLGGDLTYSYDRAVSEVPGTEGREFTRHIVSLGVNYSF